MNIDDLKINRIVNGKRDESVTVITLTGGAAAYCIYRGGQELVKKVKENREDKKFNAPLLFDSRFHNNQQSDKLEFLLVSSINDFK